MYVLLIQQHLDKRLYLPNFHEALVGPHINSCGVKTAEGKREEFWNSFRHQSTEVRETKNQAGDKQL